jgi:hypothetical protein
VKRADDDDEPTQAERYNACCRLFAIGAGVALLVLVIIGGLIALTG